MRHDGSVEYVTLNRPEVRNAFNRARHRRADRLGARRSQRVAALRVAVLAGAGNVFCAGADLAWMAETVRYTRRARTSHDAGAMAAMFDALDTLPVPAGRPRPRRRARRRRAAWRRCATSSWPTSDAMFGFTEVKLGILPAVISPYALREDRPLGRARALPDGRALRRRPRARDRPGPRRRAGAGQLDAAVERLRPRASHRRDRTRYAAAKAADSRGLVARRRPRERRDMPR